MRRLLRRRRTTPSANSCIACSPTIGKKVRAAFLDLLTGIAILEFFGTGPQHLTPTPPTQAHAESNFSYNCAMLNLTRQQTADYLHRSYTAVDGLWFMKAEAVLGFLCCLEAIPNCGPWR